MMEKKRGPFENGFKEYNRKKKGTTKIKTARKKVGATE